ncbi:metal ABC transporter permease [candidate division KSB1 bacterium]|nr:metal ABC transporter permease [candidate division KSB1 bacterium]
MTEAITFLLPPFVACVLMIGLFGYLGIHVLKREIIFIDIALAQIAAVGATVAHVFFHAGEHSLVAFLSSFGFTVLAALFYSQVGKRIKQIPHEAIIGVSYAIAAAAALFLLAIAAGGDVHLEHMLTGSILWVNWHEILGLGIVFGLVGLFHFMYRDRFIRLSEQMAQTDHHEKSALWDFLFYVSMGLVITLSVHIAGVLVIFSFLIIPATISAFYSRSWTGRLIIAWSVGILSILFGLAFSYRFDFSCGPSVVSFLGLSLVISALFRKRQ